MLLKNQIISFKLRNVIIFAWILFKSCCNLPLKISIQFVFFINSFVSRIAFLRLTRPHEYFAGENLDAEHCEALEEIFKRLQFRSLLLEDSNLNDEVGTSQEPSSSSRARLMQNEPYFSRCTHFFTMTHPRTCLLICRTMEYLQ